jgi:hypothetical protein
MSLLAHTLQRASISRSHARRPPVSGRPVWGFWEGRVRHSNLVFYSVCVSPRRVNCAWKWSCRRALGDRERMTGVKLTRNALIRPISARYPAGLSLRVSERILVSRLER